MRKSMFNFCSAFAVAILVVFAGGCTKDDDHNGDNDDITGIQVIITGSINSVTTQATKVLAFSSTDRYKLADISNDRFSIELDNGKPWGIIFLNSAEQAIGVLSFGDGIESLPLQGITAGTDTIDLQTISRNGNIFTSSHNPIGNEIILTDKEIEALSNLDDYMASLLKNPDADNNGKIDVLEGKLFKLEVIYFIKSGQFKATGLTPTYNSYKLIEGYKLFLSVEDKNFPETIYFTGPNGSPLYNSPSADYMDFGDARLYATSYLSNIEDTISYIPVGGVYTIKYKDTELTFNLPNQEYVKSNVIYPWPTVTLNGDGTMNKIDWVYKTPMGVVSYDLDAIMRSMQIQIEGTGNKCGSSNTLDSRLYDSPWLAPDIVTYTLKCQNIDWGLGEPIPGWKHIERIMMTYKDHYDNSYVVMYEKWN